MESTCNSDGVLVSNYINGNEKALEIVDKLDMDAFTENVMPLEKFEEAWKTHRSFKYLKILLRKWKR